MSFSADGNKLAWVGHDSSISVADATKENAVFNFKTKFLPFLSCIWIAPNTILAAGHGCAPLIFHQGYRDWIVLHLLNSNGVPKAKVFGRSRSFSQLELWLWPFLKFYSKYSVFIFFLDKNLVKNVIIEKF